MLELTTYGLVGLAAMLIIAFYFAYSDEIPSVRETSLFDLVTNAHLRSQMIETGAEISQYRRTIGKQQDATASLPQTIAPAERRPGAIYSDNYQNDRGQAEVFHV